jgi:deoxyinosine 3'endonuclease (endonuclease V)
MHDFRCWDAPWWVIGDKSSPVAGTSQPIFVNVGHNISPQKAVQITASLSLARVPGPVQQADLYFRELMRKRSSS